MCNTTNSVYFFTYRWSFYGFGGFGAEKVNTGMD
jgi:hypothetical protein